MCFGYQNGTVIFDRSLKLARLCCTFKTNPCFFFRRLVLLCMRPIIIHAHYPFPHSKLFPLLSPSSVSILLCPIACCHSSPSRQPLTYPPLPLAAFVLMAPSLTPPRPHYVTAPSQWPRSHLGQLLTWLLEQCSLAV